MPVVGKVAHMAKAQASAHRPDDVEDQAPLLASPRREAPALRPRKLLFAGVAGVALLGACAVAVAFHRSQAGGADPDAAAGLISFADADTAKEANSTAESTNATGSPGSNATGSPEATKDFDLSGSLLDNVTQALVMDDTDAKGDDSMLSVKKGDIVYVNNVSKKGWTFAFTKDKASGFVPSMVLNENSTLVRRDYKATEKEAKGALNVKSGERVWLTGIKEDGKDWIFIVKPDKDSSLVNGFIPEWAVHAPNSTANSTTSSDDTADAPDAEKSTSKVDDKKKASKREKK